MVQFLSLRATACVKPLLGDSANLSLGRGKEEEETPASLPKGNCIPTENTSHTYPFKHSPAATMMAQK